VAITVAGGELTSERRADGVPAEDGVILVVHTSGTAGDPKLVQFDRGAIDGAVAASAFALEATPRDPWICCLPLAHVGGMLVLLRGVLLGAPVSVHPAFDPSLIDAERDVAFVSVVPTMLGRLLDAKVDLSRFRTILVGGAHLWPDVRTRAESAGAHVIETYGLTESCGGVVYDGLPLPSVEMRVNEDGGIELRGPMLTLGYRFDAEATERAFTTTAGSGRGRG
jgi:O-succinylbenzoic acid--CoA ligase